MSEVVKPETVQPEIVMPEIVRSEFERPEPAQNTAVLPTLQCQLLVIGAGPAGIAAALTAAATGKTVLLIDQQQEPGGQVWRGQWRQVLQARRCSDPLAQRWLAALHTALHRDLMPTLVFRGNCRVVHRVGPQTVVADGEQAAVIQYEQVILCAGAREIFLPFPGWTLPGVTGAGGLQVMVKDGVSVRGKRVVVAGTGPLLLAVAASLHDAGATVVCILEQATRRQMWAFALQLWRYPSLLWQALQLRWRTRRIPWRFDSWITAAEGVDRVANVHWRNGRNAQGRIACAALACGFSLTENRELLALFGGQAVSVEDGALNDRDLDKSNPENNALDKSDLGDNKTVVETHLPGVFIAGELLGVAGARRALISGQLAAAKAVATTDLTRVSRLAKQLQHWQSYATALSQHFALRRELTELADDKTLLCRCEQVSVAAVREHGDFRSAKLATRIGMGACQGRICGSACRVLFGWAPAHTRAPLLPTPIRTLLASPATSVVRIEPVAADAPQAICPRSVNRSDAVLSSEPTHSLSPTPYSTPYLTTMR